MIAYLEKGVILKKTDLISITVPVFNAEHTLNRCLDSLLNQTYTNVEIIVVNDGSSDLSGQICDEYALRDRRIKVFHQTNKGSAAARKVGLDNSRGDYYTVCDSDDWAEPTMLEKLLDKAKKEQAEIVISDYFINDRGKEVYTKSFYNPENISNCLGDAISYRLTPNTWGKLFSMAFLKKVMPPYTEGVNLGEDKKFLIHCLLFYPKVSYLQSALYHYQKHNDAMTSNYSMEKFRQLLAVYEWEKTNCPEYKRSLLLSNIALAITGLRVDTMTQRELLAITNDITIQNLYRYKIYSKAAVLVVLSRISLSLGKKLLKIYEFKYE